MAHTTRYPLHQGLRDNVTVARHEARTRGDQHPSRRYKNQYLRLLEKTDYRRLCATVVHNYMIGKTDDVVIPHRVHGYID